MKSSTSSDEITCGLLKFNQHFRRTLSPPSLWLKSKPKKETNKELAVSTLKTEVTQSSKTSVDFQRTTQHNIQEDRTPHGDGLVCICLIH